MTRPDPDPRTTNALTVKAELGEVVGTWAYAGTVVVEMSSGTDGMDAHLTVEQAQELITNLHIKIVEALLMARKPQPRLEPEIAAKVNTTAFWNKLGVRRG